MLTEEQIIACLSHEGDRTAMLNAAYRMGMLRAADLAEGQTWSHVWLPAHDVQRKIVDAIRAEAGE